jgi:hypothetical protein
MAGGGYFAFAVRFLVWAWWEFWLARERVAWPLAFRERWATGLALF